MIEQGYSYLDASIKSMAAYFEISIDNLSVVNVTKRPPPTNKKENLRVGNLIPTEGQEKII